MGATRVNGDRLIPPASPIPSTYHREGDSEDLVGQMVLPGIARASISGSASLGCILKWGAHDLSGLCTPLRSSRGESGSRLSPSTSSKPWAECPPRKAHPNPVCSRAFNTEGNPSCLFLLPATRASERRCSGLPSVSTIQFQFRRGSHSKPQLTGFPWVQPASLQATSPNPGPRLCPRVTLIGSEAGMSPPCWGPMNDGRGWRPGPLGAQLGGHRGRFPKIALTR